MTPDDATLLERSARGDRDAFDVFVRRHQASVWRFLVGMASDPADAEDALQEAFLGAWRGAGTYGGGPSARGWILTVARNALRRGHRRRVGEPASFEPLDELGARAGWGSAEGLLEELARKEILERALACLEPEDREVLVLRELEGLDGKETAEALHIGVAAMKSRLHRARLRLVAHAREVEHG